MKKKTAKKSPNKPRTVPKDGTFNPLIKHDGKFDDLEITVKATPENWKKLKEYVLNDPDNFLYEFEEQFLWDEYDKHGKLKWHIPDIDEKKHHGLHATTHGLEGAIRTTATKVYVATEYWLAQPKKRWIKPFKNLMGKLTEEDSYNIMSKTIGGYSSERIANYAIVLSPLGILAKEKGLKLVKKRSGAHDLNVSNFINTYIDRDFVEQLNNMFKGQSDQALRHKLYIEYTEKWLKQLISERSHWVKLLELKTS